MTTHDHGHDHPHDHGHEHPHDHTADAGPTADASVRVARANDAPAVGRVQADVYRATYAGRLPADVLELFEPEAFTRAWRSGLTNPPEGVHRLLVACAGPQVVGAVALGPSQDPDAEGAWGEVTLLAVHPDARRQGHGSRLVNAAVDQLRQAGADTVTAWLLADDEETRAFLAGSGLGPDGAFRDRVVSPDGETLREVRVLARLDEPDGG